MTQNIVVTVRGTNAFITGSDDDDLLIGTSLDDQMVGLAGNDTLSGEDGNDRLDGGPGIDTARFDGLREHFQLAIASGRWSVQDLHGVEGLDQLTDIERLKFSDRKIALDLGPAEHAGQAVAVVGVLAPSLIKVPPAIGAILGLIDEGSSVLEVFQLAIDVGLVNEIAGAGHRHGLWHRWPFERDRRRSRCCGYRLVGELHGWTKCKLQSGTVSGDDFRIGDESVSHQPGRFAADRDRICLTDCGTDAWPNMAQPITLPVTPAIGAQTMARNRPEHARMRSPQSTEAPSNSWSSQKQRFGNRFSRYSTGEIRHRLHRDAPLPRQAPKAQRPSPTYFTPSWSGQRPNTPKATA
ncbi:MAG: hypothetical protein IPI16_17935 [Comamonadaceae bacterium]|nr:hypothetical protein [Comamonadaceae bacterium]